MKAREFTLTARAAWDKTGTAARYAWAAVALLLVAVVAALLVIAPLDRAIARSREDLTRHRALLVIARSRSAEDAGLARAASPARSSDLRAAIRREFSQRGLDAALPAGDSADGQVSVVIAAARFDALVAALDALVRGEGAQVVEATLDARVEPGLVRATLVLRR